MDFVDHEAEESDGSEEEELDDDGEPIVRKKTKKVKRYDDDDDEEEEEEEDEETLRKEIGDLINDDEEEEEEGSEDEVNGKRHRDEDEDEEDLEDDDYALLEENLGRPVAKRKKKFKRVKRFEDDSDNEGEARPEDVRAAIANELFDDDDDDGAPPAKERARPEEDTFGLLSGSEESENEDDFIVDDNDEPISRPKKKRGIRHNDEAMQQAQDIFGVEFDFEDFQNLEEADDYDEEDDEGDEAADYDEEGEGGEPGARRKSTKGKARPKKRTVRKSIFELYEPSELERSHLTEKDNDIRNVDEPERFQLRSVPVTKALEPELEEESEWIWKQAFDTNTISIQHPEDEHSRQPAGGRKPISAVPKIKDALNFIRNSKNEVPFIAFYRKEYVEPELNIHNLWTVYKWDERWCQLQLRKQNMQRLLKNMQNYQIDLIVNRTGEEAPMPAGSRTVSERDIERIKTCLTFDEIKDCWTHFQLYHGNDVPSMKKFVEKKQRRRRERELDELGQPIERAEGEEADQVEGRTASLKIAQRRDMYTSCRDAGIGGMAARFGLTSEQFGENLRDNYARHDVEQHPEDPEKTAEEFLCPRFSTTKSVISGAKYMIARQIAADPLTRKCVRQTFFERAKIQIRPTKKGRKEIDENHPCYGYKYLKNKPVSELKRDQYMQIHLAKEAGLLEVHVGLETKHGTGEREASTSGPGYFDEIKQLFEIDEYSQLVQSWNELRNAALKQALDQFLYPQFEKELKAKLLQECHDVCLKEACRKLYDWLKVAPYTVESQAILDDEDFDLRDGIRVLTLAFLPSNETPAFAALLDADGLVADYIRLPYLLLNRQGWANEKDKERREKDRLRLKDFILRKKPHVIGVGSETMMARLVIQDVHQLVEDLVDSDQFPLIPVELVDNEMSVVFQDSKRAVAEFHDFPSLLRQAVSLGRRLLDPLVEFTQLCTPDEEILCLKYHPMQEYLNSEELLNALHLEFVNRVNEVGVDLNRCLLHQHTALTVPFICGLGPRKGAALLRTLKKQQTPMLESRTQLIMNCRIGAVVFVNCVGFIKIDTAAMADSGTETYIEPLDSTRVHPETYDWARKMAVDALEYDDSDQDADPAGALDEILENPEKLKDLDLDAFAVELQRQGLGSKTITLYDIRAELNSRYKDLREPYQPPTPEQIFHLLTRETPESFHIGKLVVGRVTGICRSKPQDDQYDKANPIRNDETGLWQCPFCLRNDYSELSDVWSHFDSKDCPGQATGVRVRLDNGVTGTLDTKLISDKEVSNPEERVKVGLTIHARILRMNIEKFHVGLTSRSSDLLDKNHQYGPQRDYCYDFELEDADQKAEAEHKRKQNRQTYTKRVIVHPSFHNIDYSNAEKLLAEMDVGDAIIRPSSKGTDHLTLTWKVSAGISQHVDIEEREKDNAFSLGKQLYIGGETYEDLDEILARYVHPMACFAREIAEFRYFQAADGGKREVLEALLIEEKRKQPNKIHYFLSPSAEMPGKFALAYLPKNKVITEFVTVTPDGIRYRKIMFQSLDSLLRWFKEHFKEPPPAAAMSHPMRTPGSARPDQTPTLSASALARAAAAMPAHLYGSLSSVGGQHTPFGGMPPPAAPTAAAYFGGHTPGGSGFRATPSTSGAGVGWTAPSHTPGGSAQAGSSRPASRSGDAWRAQAESWQRRTPRDGAQPTRTPAYATPGASSMMSISPTSSPAPVSGHSRRHSDQTPLTDEWN